MYKLPENRIFLQPLLIGIFLFWCQALHAQSEPSPVSKNYKFTSDVFSSRIPLWQRILKPYAGRKNVRYLEIGVFEGRSLFWMLENVLTHPQSRAVALDAFWPSYEPTFLSNLEKSGVAYKVKIVKGLSRFELRQLPVHSFDIIYVDASHTADNTLSDMVLSWDLLKVGGLMIIDDYPLFPDMPFEIRPGGAIKAFVLAHRRKIEIVHNKWQIIIRRKKDSCVNGDWATPHRTKQFCTPVGRYLFFWDKKELIDRKTGMVVKLSKAEKELVALVIKASRDFSELKPVPEDLQTNAALARLLSRLELPQVNRKDLPK